MKERKFSFRAIAVSMWCYAKGLVHRLKEEEVTLIASGIAFNWIFCLIPLLLLFTSLFGVLLHSSEQAVVQIEELLNRVFPDQPYAESIKSSIRQMVGDIITYRASFGIFGAAVLVWTGTSLFSSIRNALHRVYRMKSTKNLFLSILEDIVWVVIVAVLFTLLNFVTVAYSIIDALTELVPGFAEIDLQIFAEAVPALLSFTLTLVMFFVVYRFIPDLSPSSMAALVSAVTTTVLWEAASRIFGWYLSEFHSFGRLYGTYAFILVFFVWIYYSCVVFVIGGIVGQLYRERKAVRQSVVTTEKPAVT